MRRIFRKSSDKPTLFRRAVLWCRPRCLIPTATDTSPANAKNFELYDNNKPQKIDAELIEQPMSVVLAIQANADVEEFLRN